MFINRGCRNRTVVDDPELFFHTKRMSRLTRALRAPLDEWEAGLLARVRQHFGDEHIRQVRMQLDEAFIELATTIDFFIEN
jgi:hypothetical protein